MAVNEFDLKVICPTRGEYARYEYVAVLVPSDTTARRENEMVVKLKCRRPDEAAANHKATRTFMNTNFLMRVVARTPPLVPGHNR
jgi:hypothetical protein